MQQTGNRILDVLPEAERQGLLAALSPTEVKRGDMLFRVGDTIGNVLLPLDSVVSVGFACSGASVVDGAMSGRDGVGPGAIISGISLNHAVVRLHANASRVMPTK